MFFVTEIVDWLGVLAVRKARQSPRQAESHVSGVFTLTERLSFRILRAVKYLGQVTRCAKLGKALEVEQVRGSRADKRCVGLRRHMRNALEQGHVLGMLAE